MRCRCPVVILLAWATCVWAQEAAQVRVAQTDGDVGIRKSAAQGWRAASEGDALDRGDRLATAGKSAALLMWSNGSMVKLYPNSEIGLAGVTFDLEKRTETTLVDLERGRLFVKAQVPDHIFTEFKVRMGPLEARTQGAEFAIERDARRNSFTAWTVSGRVVTEVETWARVRIEAGRQGTITAGARLKMDDLQATDERTSQALAKVSRDLGGSLRTGDITADPGGRLVSRIGGVQNRRGNTPYKVQFKALTAGGSGRISFYRWEFGDGEFAYGREVEHTFITGLYTVVLRVEDANGQKASAQIGISAQVDCGC